jgi:integrase
MSQRVPSYRRHKQSGQAIVTLTDPSGRRRDVLLGMWKSSESRGEYARQIAEWEAAGRTLPQAPTATDLSVNELLVQYWRHAQMHYRLPDGSPSEELDNVRVALKPLKEMYGHTPAAKFGPLSLKALREKMVSDPIIQRTRCKDSETGKWTIREKTMPYGLSRGVINSRINRIRRSFSWGVESELIPASVAHGLREVKGLKAGRTAAREAERVKPVGESLVQETLPFLPAVVADMVRVQLYSGMRSTEICIMRARDIDMTGQVWIYKPSRFKTQYLGHARNVALGPVCQEIIKHHLKPNIEAFLFSPADSVALQQAQKRNSRKSPVQPSQVSRKKSKPNKTPGDRYDRHAYARAVARACKRAGIESWHPHQLRHTAALRARREQGLEAARALLGHRTVVLTEHYADADAALAKTVALKIG